MSPATQKALFANESSTTPDVCPMCGRKTTNGMTYTPTCWRRLDDPATVNQIRLGLLRSDITVSNAWLKSLTRQRRGDLFAWLFGAHGKPAWLDH